MKKFLLAFFVCTLMCTAGSFAQDSTRALKENAVMFELGGNGLGISLSYEGIMPLNNKTYFGLRIGGGLCVFNPFNRKEVPTGLLPLAELKMLSRKDNGFIETGIGFTLNPTPTTYYEKVAYDVWEAYQYYEHMLFVHFGYRYQDKSGFILSVAATPAIIFYHDQYVTPEDNGKRISISLWIGFTLGQSF